MSKLVLYSTHCPRCVVLEKKLKTKNIEYEEVNDENLMLEKGFTTVPMLEVDGVVLNYKEANEWINNN